ncbi:hypothetical protein F2Q68_00022848 [Brassica cretica]|uniref:Uncharacterized protein n=1 Tax=Brassica cretica TaxID=69181 RepID=A0A8S9FT23_BRACR|nr:hypothetical protein F2Q68_00022848 [Brassica cretica]
MTCFWWSSTLQEWLRSIQEAPPLDCQLIHEKPTLHLRSSRFGFCHIAGGATVVTFTGSEYTEDGLLSVDENRQGHAAAFGDDIAIECLATEFKREIYVVQAHGSDGMVEEENCVFFLPHKPRSEVIESPVFLFMKGTGWCGGGADHYEPLIASPSQIISQEKVAFVL